MKLLLLLVYLYLPIFCLFSCSTLFGKEESGFRLFCSRGNAEIRAVLGITYALDTVSSVSYIASNVAPYLRDVFHTAGLLKEHESLASFQIGSDDINCTSRKHSNQTFFFSCELKQAKFMYRKSIHKANGDILIQESPVYYPTHIVISGENLRPNHNDYTLHFDIDGILPQKQNFVFTEDYSVERCAFQR